MAALASGLAAWNSLSCNSSNVFAAFAGDGLELLRPIARRAWQRPLVFLKPNSKLAIFI
jgi:hypothetical protein